MISYPKSFTCEAESEASIDSLWDCKSPDGLSRVAIPREFFGPGGGLSPEDLFNHALTNCFIATFKVFATHSKLSFSEIRVSSKLIVDVDDQKNPVMKELFLSAKITGPSNPERALSVARKAARNGFVLNSVKTQIHLDVITE